MADERRINVGLTRARCSMLVIGNAAALNSDPVWGQLLSHARVKRQGRMSSNRHLLVHLRVPLQLITHRERLIQL